MTLAWGAKVSPEFRARVLHMAARLGCDPSWLMAIMSFETGRTFSPAARNAQSGATGLIQFMPATARELNTSVEALAAMTAVEQLDYVERYFQRYAATTAATLASWYMAVLWPAARDDPDDAVLFETPSAAYTQNRDLDINNDGRVTKAEAASFVARHLAEGLQPGNASEEIERTPTPQQATPPGGAPFQREDKRMDPLTLVGVLTSVFSPLIRAKAEKALGTDVGKPLADNLIALVQQQTGRTDPMEAVAVARQDPAIVTKAEKATEDWFAQVAPALERVAAIDRDDLKAADASRDAAAVRTDGSDVRKRIDAKIWIAYAIGAVILAAIAITQLLKTGNADGQIIGALILAFGGLGGAIITMVNYGYGSTAGSQAKDVVIGEYARRANGRPT